MVHGGEPTCPALFLLSFDTVVTFERCIRMSPVPGREFRGTVEGGALDMHASIILVVYMCVLWPFGAKSLCLPQVDVKSRVN